MAAEPLISKTSPLNFERYELKYLIPETMIQPICRYIERFCVSDPHADDTGSYWINTLYLDSDDYRLFRRRENDEDRRFTMRMRSYGDQPKPPYFVEIKYKQDGVVKKYRHPINDEMLHQFCNDPSLPPFHELSEFPSKNLAMFARLGTTYNVSPKIQTRYRRIAYMSILDSYARVTFDLNLQYHEERDYHLSPNLRAMTHYDNPLHFPNGCNVILELKCDTQVPLWMIDLIRTFDLRRSGFSKYCSSLAEMMGPVPVSSRRRATPFRTGPFAGF
ncbi:MAG: polyphosphate polymerase domain-containing protein [Pseudomonadota bacterium]